MDDANDETVDENDCGKEEGEECCSDGTCQSGMYCVEVARDPFNVCSVRGDGGEASGVLEAAELDSSASAQTDTTLISVLSIVAFIVVGGLVAGVWFYYNQRSYKGRSRLQSNDFDFDAESKGRHTSIDVHVAQEYEEEEEEEEEQQHDEDVDEAEPENQALFNPNETNEGRGGENATKLSDRV
jgi:hypothetical protein